MRGSAVSCCSLQQMELVLAKRRWRVWANLYIAKGWHGASALSFLSTKKEILEGLAWQTTIWAWIKPDVTKASFLKPNCDGVSAAVRFLSEPPRRALLRWFVRLLERSGAAAMRQALEPDLVHFVVPLNQSIDHWLTWKELYLFPSFCRSNPGVVMRIYFTWEAW